MAKDYNDDADYKCYMLGCRSAGMEPVGIWRFRLLQEAYRRHAAEAGRNQQGATVPPFVLEQLAKMIAAGYKIAAGGAAEDDEPGTAACGVREPHRPLEPVLVGCAARALPTADALDESFWRT